MHAHPRNVFLTFLSFSLFTMACSDGDTNAGNAGPAAGGNTVDPNPGDAGASGQIDDATETGGSGGSDNTGGIGGGTGGDTGGTGGDTGGTGGDTGGTGGDTGGTGGNTGGTGGNTGGTGGSPGTQLIPCNGTPNTCTDLGADQAAQYAGCCDGNTVYWCDDQTGAWELHDVDCSTSGMSCDFDPTYDGMWCVGGGGGGGGGSTGTCNGTPATCADVGSDQASQYYGCCNGDTVYWCDDQTGAWELHSMDCTSTGTSCDYDVTYDGMWCVDPNISPVNPNDPPGPGPGPSCPNLPPMNCSGSATYCSALVQFDPVHGDGYIDYPENGETWTNQYRSYIRRDLMMLIQYATAKVACKAAGWTSGNGEPLGLIDMSEANGAIPGTSIGQPGHPAGTHVNGRDIDTAYYQTSNMSDNRARAVCNHYINGKDQYHCVDEPHLLDAWRNAAFLGFLFEHPSLRVVGADGKVGPHLDSALNYLCQNNWLTSYACSNRKLAYEVTNQGQGWYLFHHHHFHVSFTPPSYPTTALITQDPTCLIENCDAEAWNDFLGIKGLLGR